MLQYGSGDISRTFAVNVSEIRPVRAPRSAWLDAVLIRIEEMQRWLNHEQNNW